MTTFYREAAGDEDLPDDGLLAVELRNPDEKPRIRLVPIEMLQSEVCTCLMSEGFNVESAKDLHNSWCAVNDGNYWYTVAEA